MLNCRQVTMLYSESQERKLGFNERMSVQMHVMMCSGCRNFGKQMPALRLFAQAYAKGENEKADESGEP